MFLRFTAVKLVVFDFDLSERVVRSHRRPYGIVVQLSIERDQRYHIAANAEDWGNYLMSCFLAGTYCIYEHTTTWCD